MHQSLLAAVLIAAGILTACQTGERQTTPGNFRSNANKAQTNDPVASLKRY